MKLTIKLDDALYDEIELLTPEGERVERFIEKRLSLLKRINPDRPYMYLNGDDLSTLQAFFGGKPFKDSRELIDIIRRTQTFRLPGPLDVTLEMDIIAQLKIQAEGMGVPFEKYFRDNLNEALMFIVGVPIQHITVPSNAS